MMRVLQDEVIGATYEGILRPLGSAAQPSSRDFVATELPTLRCSGFIYALVSFVLDPLTSALSLLTLDTASLAGFLTAP